MYNSNKKKRRPVPISCTRFLVSTLALTAVAALELPALAVAADRAAGSVVNARPDILIRNYGATIVEFSEPAAASSVARTWRIMPLGDSITNGSGSRDSYRRPLWHMLTAAAIDADFVGSRVTAVPNPDFDLEHQGHSGWRADQFLENGMIANWAQTYLPDVVLIHLGTNDLLQGQGVASTIVEIGQIIDSLRAANPMVIILVAQIIPMQNPTIPTVMELNLAIPALVASKDSADSPVRLVDQFSGFDAAGDTLDGIHPNVGGEDKVAQEWFDAIQPLLAEAENEAPAFTSAPVTAATQAVPYSYTATVEDPNADLVTIAALQQPQWLLVVDNGDGTVALTGTPGNADVGANPVRLVATDPFGLTAEQDFTIDVANVNDAPTFTSVPVTGATEAVVYSYLASAEDPDADTVQITAPILPDWLTLNDNSDGTAMLTGSPGGAEAGIHAVELQAQETAPGTGLVARQSFAITVTTAPEGPSIWLIGDQTVAITEGDDYNDAGAEASDPQDGDLTEQITIDNPVDSDVPATYTISYSVSDSAGNEALAERTVTVQEGSTMVGQQSDSGGGAAGILELITLLTVSAAGCRSQKSSHQTFS